MSCIRIRKWKWNQNVAKVGTGINSFGATTLVFLLSSFFGDESFCVLIEDMARYDLDNLRRPCQRVRKVV